MTAKYDSEGKKTYEYLFYSNNVLGYNSVWILETYDLHYYSDHTGNETVTAPAPTAYAYGGTLYIQSLRAEQVVIYSLTGAKIYEGAVQTGTTTVNATRLPKGVYIVAFGDGTRQKVANN
ncbi:MAG: T9SS type A sorting domain-containing protein [Tannerella sp.]|jgi:hypothetical protein|nr:T9SS type A sorting domain-containing protein [Tannerella sp.]